MYSASCAIVRDYAAGTLPDIFGSRKTLQMPGTIRNPALLVDGKFMI